MAIDWLATGALVGAISGIVGMVTGAGGLVLGILNRRHATQQSAMRVRVEATYKTDLPAKRFEVRVVNASAFPVRIERVGLALRDEEGLREIFLGGLDDSLGRPSAYGVERVPQLPLELAARSSAVIDMTMQSTMFLAMMAFDHAFAIAATGERFVSAPASPIVGMILRQMRDAAERETVPTLR